MHWGSTALWLSSYSWNTDIRSTDYPPKSISEALKFSQSDFVTNARQRAKIHILQQNTNRTYLPPWAMTWPGGQLSTIGVNGLYTQNIEKISRNFYSILWSIIVTRAHCTYTFVVTKLD